jgi:hypothetical protein
MYQEGQQEDTHGDNNVASFTNVLINYVIDGFFVSVLYSVDQSIPFDEYICGIGIEKKNAFFPLKGRGVHNILFAPNYIIWAITINKYFFPYYKCCSPFTVCFHSSPSGSSLFFLKFLYSRLSILQFGSSLFITIILLNSPLMANENKKVRTSLEKCTVKSISKRDGERIIKLLANAMNLVNSGAQFLKICSLKHI